MKSNKKKGMIIDALVKSFGIQNAAYQAVGISSQTYYEWLKNDQDFAIKARAAIEEGQQLRLDRAEFVQAKLLDSKDEGMRLKTSMYILNNKGKQRGYNNDTPPEPEQKEDLSHLSIEETMQYLALKAKIKGA
jgi:lipopolysaccharide biosynthesis protein